VTASAYTWNGLTADYLPHEREFILALASGGHRQEAELVHEIKAMFDATLDEEEQGIREYPEASQPRGNCTTDSDWSQRASIIANPPSSSSVPTGHGSFAIPQGIQKKLASKRGQSVR
jgi:hypothetical protein